MRFLDIRALLAALVLLASFSALASAQEGGAVAGAPAGEAGLPPVDDGSWVGEDPTADPDAALDTVLETPPPPLPDPNAAPKGRDPKVPYGALIAATARRRDVPVALFTALVWQESGFRARAKSPVGARGLTQLMPATARGLGVRNSYDPKQNLDGGARYLRQQLTAFRGSKRLALAAYNAGPGAVRRYRGVPPYTETRNYVKRILAREAQLRRQGVG